MKDGLQQNYVNFVYNKSKTYYYGDKLPQRNKVFCWLVKTKLTGTSWHRTDYELARPGFKHSYLDDIRFQINGSFRNLAAGYLRQTENMEVIAVFMIIDYFAT